jgi:hypothetical protein
VRRDACVIGATAGGRHPNTTVSVAAARVLLGYALGAESATGAQEGANAIRAISSTG